MHTSPRKIRIEVQTRLHRRPRRWFLGIPRNQTEDVIASTMPRLHHETEIWRQSTVVRRARRLVILVGRDHVVGELARAFLDFALVIGFGIIFVLFRHGFHLVDRVGYADEGAPGHARDGVAGGADFAVDLKAAAEAEGTSEEVEGEIGMGGGLLDWEDERLVVEGFVPFLMFPGVLDGVKPVSEK